MNQGDQSADLTERGMQTLAVDISASGIIKAVVLDQDGNPQSGQTSASMPTPGPVEPDAVLSAIAELANGQEAFDRVSVGFPGVVHHGITQTAANLTPSWIGFDLATTLSQHLNKPVRVANGADIQGFGAISRHGVELVITLETGFGSALFVDGKLVSNLELAHHRFRKKQTYEEQLGQVALDEAGEEKWNSRLARAIRSLETLFNYDRLYISGGNAKMITLDLPANVRIVPNVTGLLGGIALWQDNAPELTSETSRRPPEGA